jgi:hypothetical protein
MPTPRTVQIVGQLLQITDTTGIRRVLLLAVAIAQNPAIAVWFADLGNVELVGRFFKSSAKCHFCFAYCRSVSVGVGTIC